MGIFGYFGPERKKFLEKILGSEKNFFRKNFFPKKIFLVTVDLKIEFGVF